MATDVQLVMGALQSLRRNAVAVREGMTTELIALDLELMLRRPLIVSNVQTALQECLEQGWVTSGDDEWGQTLWTLTADGNDKARNR